VLGEHLEVDLARPVDGRADWFLALAFAATTASGATFLGFPGLAYEHGTAALLSAVLYPAGVYLGVLICMRLVANVGDRFGSRSIPEFLGDRYQSDGIRVIVTVASLLLFFYPAGQLLSVLGLGGALARAVLGGRLYEEGSTPNEALPATD
jgi:sodium/proline symporter